VSSLTKQQEIKLLNLLGLAFRARMVITGEKEVLNAVKTDKAKLVFIASDASDKTKDRFDKKCFFHHVVVNYDLHSDDIMHALGKSLCKILTITDEGFKLAAEKIIMEVK
jgi:ribosomal protein L7Ae-like RNA K-turn-binding protein